MGSFFYFDDRLRDAYLKKYKLPETERYSALLNDFVRNSAIELIFELLIKDDAVGKDLIDMKIKEIIK